MKTIGLVGGMSWESTQDYYRIINQRVKERAGGFHSAKIVLYSLDFEEVERRQHQGRWEDLTALMIDAAQGVERAGADCLLLCTNTMHLTADAVQDSIRIPLLHIVDVTADAVKAHGFGKVGLLGTRYTMEKDFYKGRLLKKHGLEVLVPDEKDRELIHAILYDELCLGTVSDASKQVFRTIIAKLSNGGAQGIILGCTEIPMLVKQQDYKIPLFDTTCLHAEAAVDFALS
jgi:aspartate racemase